MKKNFSIFGIVAVLLIIQPLGAQTWEASKRITWTSGHSYKPKIAIDSNNDLHVVWQDMTPGDWEIYYAKSTDDGLTWTQKRLTWASGASRNPKIAIDSANQLYVVWQGLTGGNDEIYFKKSTDGGATWTTKRLTWTPVHSHDAAIAVELNDHICVIWAEDIPMDFEIFYKKSTDGGASWTTKRLTWSSGGSGAPDIAIDANNYIHIVWENDPPSGGPDIFYKKSTDAGASWTTKRLTWYFWKGYAWDPQIAADSNNKISVVWSDIYDIYSKRSTDDGESWSTQRLTWNPGDSSSPDVACDSDDNIHIVWEDSTPGNFETYYKRSTDGGASWTAKRLTWNTGLSNSPAVALNSDNDIHVVWHDSSPGNAEIYYRKGKQ